jgi:hypothetical protein
MQVTNPVTCQPEDGDEQAVIAPGKVQTRITNIDLEAVEVQTFPETLHPAGRGQDMKVVIVLLKRFPTHPLSNCSASMDAKNFRASVIPAP